MNYQELINKFKSDSRAVDIWLWHEETLFKMKKNLQELRRKRKWIKI